MGPSLLLMLMAAGCATAVGDDDDDDADGGAGAALTFAIEDANNKVYANQNRVVIAEVPPAPDPFNGQFLQLDVLTVEP